MSHTFLPVSVTTTVQEKGIKWYRQGEESEDKLSSLSNQNHQFDATKRGSPVRLADVKKDRLFIKDEYQYVRIMLSEIDFVKSSGNYVEIHSHNKKRLVKRTLKDIESKLDTDFFQVHRSYIVNIKRVERVGGSSLLIGQTEIPIIKQRKDELLLLLNAFG